MDHKEEDLGSSISKHSQSGDVSSIKELEDIDAPAETSILQPQQPSKLTEEQEEIKDFLLEYDDVLELEKTAVKVIENFRYKIIHTFMYILKEQIRKEAEKERLNLKDKDLLKQAEEAKRLKKEMKKKLNNDMKNSILDKFWKEVIIDILTPDLYIKTFFETKEVEITIKYLGNVCWNKECESNKEKKKFVH